MSADRSAIERARQESPAATGEFGGAIRDRVEDDVYDILRTHAEMYFRERATAYLYPHAAPCEAVLWEDVPEIDRRLEEGLLSEADYGLLADACTLVRGNDRTTGLLTYFAPIVRTTITVKTVQRGIEAADMLRRCGLHARPVVCGYEIHPDAALTAAPVEALVFTRERPR